MAYCIRHKESFLGRLRCKRCAELGIFDNLICSVHDTPTDEDGSCDKCLAEQKKNPIDATITIEKERKEITEHPPHYNQGKIGVSDFIEDQKLPWPAANIIKYICRYRYKGDALGDLYKAKEYLERQIKLVEREG